MTELITKRKFKPSFGTYEVFDRLVYLLTAENVSLSDYQKTFERSRESFFRDMKHLKIYYDIDFVFDKERKVYKRSAA